MTHLIVKAAAERLHPNIKGACGSYDEFGVWHAHAGRLIYCDRCLGKIHCAIWVSEVEAVSRMRSFSEQHARCS